MTTPDIGMKAAIARIGRMLRAFAGDARGTVAIQTLIFSVLLFGSAGLVLDAGRVYATHSQMQAFADQMAIAAANELDGGDDAIERAAQAVFGVDGTPLLEKAGLGVGLFEVASVDFYSGLAPSGRPQNDMSEAFPSDARLARATEISLDFASGDPAAAANAATVAVVSVAEKRVRSTIARLTAPVVNIAVGTGAGGAEGPLFSDGLDIAAIAAASLERRSCAALSTLALCNPWEGMADSPLRAPKEDPGYSVPGRSLVYFAPNFAARGLDEAPQTTPNAASIFPWDVRNQIFRVTGPIADTAELCSPDHLLTLVSENAGTEGAPDYMVARDRCLMARAHGEMICWGPRQALTVAPVDGDVVARALNIVFDNWLPPFRQALTADLPVDGTGLMRTEFFEPDRLATTTFESADRHGPDPEIDLQQDGVPDYNVPPNTDSFRALYDTVPMPGHTSLDPVHSGGIGYDPCHDGTYAKYAGGGAGAACSLDFVGNYYEGGADGAGAVRAELEHYWSTMYGVDPDTLPGHVTAWYELYQLEKDLFSALDTDDTNSRIVQYSDQNTARYGLSSPDEKYVKHGPDEYLNVSGNGTLLNAGYERRRLRSAMVDCAATVAPGPDEAGRYAVDLDDVRIIDVYLPAPPGIFCGPGDVGCGLSSAIETRLYVELVDDRTELPEHRRYVARLVR